MEILPPKQGFLGLDLADDENRHPENKVVIIPFGLEASVSYGHGTAKGPEAIIDASHQVELFDDELWCEPYRNFSIETLAPFPVTASIPDALDKLQNLTSKILAENKFPLILGGEHTLTVAAIRALSAYYPEITILHFDAHADLRDGYAGLHYSHAAAIRRCLDISGISVVSVGIRSISAEEVLFLEQNHDRIQVHWGKDKQTWNLDAIVQQLSNNPVYISFDLDAFDSSLMPATGTPEPGGMFWEEALAIIKRVALTHTLIGADIVELAPQPHMHACDFLAARLAYKILAYRFGQQ